MTSVEQTLMINNNPYIVPERPMKQSKVTIQPVPLLPHQINRRQEEAQQKYHTQMLKRSTIPYYMDTSIKEVTRIPLSPQTIIKSQPLQVSNVTSWESSRELPNSLHFRELSQRINAINERLDSQERRLMIMMEAKKQQASTTLSDSTAHTYEAGGLFVSKQMQKYSQFQANCQNSTELVQKLKEQISSFKFEREKSEVNFKQQINFQLNEQKNAITFQLLDNFRQSLKDKFALEQQKINDSIHQIVKAQEAKIQNMIFELRKQMTNQIYFLRQDLKTVENRDKSSMYNLQSKQKNDRLNFAISDLRSQYLGFKDHVFKSILITHHHEQEIAKIKEKMQILSASLEKRQISPYEGHLHVSTEKSHLQIIRINFQSYLTAISRHESIKANVNEVTYYIDTEGFLLDIHGFYILNNKNVKIKIEESEIWRLRQMGILQ